MSGASSTAVFDNLTLETQALELVVRCECGMTLIAPDEKRLVELVQLHFDEIHPALGAQVPANLILAMAEQKEKKL